MVWWLTANVLKKRHGRIPASPFQGIYRYLPGGARINHKIYLGLIAFVAEIRTWYLLKKFNTVLYVARAVALTVNFPLLLAESCVQTQSRSWNISSRQSVRAVCSSEAIQYSPVSYHSTSITYSFTCHTRYGQLQAAVLTPPSEYILPSVSTCSVRSPQVNVPVMNCKRQDTLPPVLLTVLVQLRKCDSYLQ